ncbi:MAG: energy-coupling factor transporter transmembrane protein EcfT [Lachnospiraceae bacterium]|nr:energy-coupling factor transporter transmembrane protein EcfT [Lachnospiraceae bacterium]
MTALSEYNPIVILVYFLAVAGLAMFIMNPVLLFVSFFGSLLVFYTLNRGKRDRSKGMFLLLFLLLALLNPIFHHNGTTVLFVVNDNPITTEALAYGFTSATMVVSVIYWFRSFSTLMTGDKLLYVFGKISPKFSLMLSMALRYIPLFADKFRQIKAARRALGLYKQDNLPDTLKSNLKAFVALGGWSLENGIVTADSMEARGYGSGRRTFFSRYVFKKRDLAALIVLLLLTSAVVAIKLSGSLNFVFYPELNGELLNKRALWAYACYMVLTLLPVIGEAAEREKWKSLRSKI